ncbi:hypothetical protein [Streptomyces sp. NPDC055692]|uniref:hypothetical protein n=1 Tax=Streptomyces sp. NPDC055692 TaxID=3155683 RepID=UPI00343602AC
MNELELAQLAMPAANTLLTAMVSDGWQAFKTRFARIVAGRSGDVDSTEESIDQLRQRVIEYQTRGDEQQARNEIFALLCAVLGRDSEAGASLKKLLEDVTSSDLGVRAQSISQEATVRDNGVSFQQVSGTQNYRAN